MAGRALVFLLTVVLAGCGVASDDQRRVLLIGLDGADWQVIEPLAEAGRLPNLQALRRGSWGALETLRDIPLSPAIWTSVATGQVPARHGIGWFLVDTPAGRAPVRSTNRKTPAIWNILASRGRRAISIGWWASYPAEDVGNGIIVSDALGFHGFGRSEPKAERARTTHPSAIAERVWPLIPEVQQVSPEFALRFMNLTRAEYDERAFDPVRSLRPDPSNPIHLFQQSAVTAQGYAAIGEELLRSEPFDLAMVYFEQIDSLSHLFMKYAPPRLPWIEEADELRFGNLVTEWYVHQDELIGRLLSHIDLDTTAVFVVSDHGFKSGDERPQSAQGVDIENAHLDHRRLGILIARGPGIRRGARIEGASVVDVTPTLLAYLGVPVGRDMDGRVLTELFEAEALPPLRYVQSHGPLATPKPAEHAEDQPSAVELREMHRGLQALGYVEEAQTTSPDGSAPSSPELHNNLAASHLQRGAVDEAVRDFERALDLAPGNLPALLGLAEIARARGERLQSERLALRALASNPNAPAALVHLAELKREVGAFEESVHLFRQSLQTGGPTIAALIGLGDGLARSGDARGAEAAFRSALKLEPASPEAHFNLGVALAQQGRAEEAQSAYTRVLELAGDRAVGASALNNLAALAADRDPIESVRLLEQAVSRYPSHVESRHNLALQYLETQRAPEAVALLEEATRLAPEHEGVQLALGLAYLDQGENSKAYQRFTLVQRLFPENWRAAVALAAIHAASERPEETRRLLEAAERAGGEPASVEMRRYPVLRNFVGESSEN